MLARVLRLAGLALLAALVLFSAVTFGDLPASIAQHFDASGAPTRFEETSLVSWFALPAIAAFTWGLMTVVGAQLPAHPELFNFPQKARFLALPPSHRGPVIAEMRAFLEATGVLVVALLLVVQLMVWRVATQGSAGALAKAPLVGAVLLPVLLLLWLPRLGRAVSAAERRVQAERTHAAR
jgi:uncharacterized membrane protein